MNLQAKPIFKALTIAGSDSGGGAGIQADLKTFSACGVYGASVITALTAQNTCGVEGILPIPIDFIQQQLATTFADIAFDAVKIGMLGNADRVHTVAKFLSGIPELTLVLDPVIYAKSGDALLEPDAIDRLKQELIPMATLITPNLPEAALLLGTPEATTLKEMEQTARELYKLGSSAVLLKGGHLRGEQSPDILFDGENINYFHTRRIATQNTHGTGCTLASAITAELAKGEDMLSAVTQAKSYIQAAIQAANQLKVGKGKGPVHHFYALWK